MLKFNTSVALSAVSVSILIGFGFLILYGFLYLTLTSLFKSFFPIPMPNAFLVSPHFFNYLVFSFLVWGELLIIFSRKIQPEIWTIMPFAVFDKTNFNSYSKSTNSEFLSTLSQRTSFAETISTSPFFLNSLAFFMIRFLLFSAVPSLAITNCFVAFNDFTLFLLLVIVKSSKTLFVVYKESPLSSF